MYDVPYSVLFYHSPLFGENNKNLLLFNNLVYDPLMGGDPQSENGHLELGCMPSIALTYNWPSQPPRSS